MELSFLFLCFLEQTSFQKSSEGLSLKYLLPARHNHSSSSFPSSGERFCLIKKANDVFFQHYSPTHLYLHITCWNSLSPSTRERKQRQCREYICSIFLVQITIEENHLLNESAIHNSLYLVAGKSKMQKGKGEATNKFSRLWESKNSKRIGERETKEPENMRKYINIQIRKWKRIWEQEIYNHYHEKGWFLMHIQIHSALRFSSSWS